MDSLINAENTMQVCVACFWLEFAISAVLMWRQLNHLRNRKWRPPELSKYPEYTEGIFHLSAIMKHDSIMQDLKIKFFTTTIWTVTLCSNLIPFMWDSFQLADSEYDFIPNFLPLEMRQDISFGFWFAIFEILVLDFPVKFFQKQLLQAYGFHNKSMLHSVRMQINETVVSTMNRTLTSFCISFFINAYDEHTSEQHTLVRQSLLVVVYSMSLLIFEMLLLRISFLDEKYIPIPPGPLRDRVETICEKFGYPMDNVFIEVVPPETPMNAYCYCYFGMFSRIVLLSTIIEGFYDPPKSRPKVKSPGLNVQELEAIFAHEMGHFILNHNEQKCSILNILADPLVFATAVYLKDKKFLYEAFSFSPNDTASLPYPLLPGLLLAEQVLLRPWSEFMSSLFNPYGSSMETEADAFAVPLGLGKELKKALVKMDVLCVGFPSSDPFYAFFYDHHPMVIERMRDIDNVR